VDDFVGVLGVDPVFDGALAGFVEVRRVYLDNVRYCDLSCVSVDSKLGSLSSLRAYTSHQLLSLVPSVGGAMRLDWRVEPATKMFFVRRAPCSLQPRLTAIYLSQTCKLWTFLDSRELKSVVTRLH